MNKPESEISGVLEPSIKAKHLFYLFLNNEQTGPYTIAQIKSMWSAGTITVQTLYWVEGNPEWAPLGDIAYILESPLPEPQVNQNISQQVIQNELSESPTNQQLNPLGIQLRTKSKRIAVLLSLLFPFIGCLYAAPVAGILCGVFEIFFAYEWYYYFEDRFAISFVLPFYIGSIVFAIRGVGRFNQRFISDPDQPQDSDSDSELTREPKLVKKHDWMMFRKIETREDALSIINLVTRFYYLGVIAYLIIGLATSDIAWCIIGTVYGIGDFFLRNFHSRIVSILFALFAACGIAYTISDGSILETCNGWIIVLNCFAALRAVEATFKLNGRFYNEASKTKLHGMSLLIPVFGLVILLGIDFFVLVDCSSKSDPQSARKSESIAEPNSSPAPVSAPSEDNAAKTIDEWADIITKDAKLSTLRTMLGEPDANKITKDGLIQYSWSGRVNTGATKPDFLRVYALPYQNSAIIIAIDDSVIKEPKVFSWTSRVRAGFKSEVSQGIGFDTWMKF